VDAQDGQAQTSRNRTSVFVHPRIYRLIFDVRTAVTDLGLAGLFLAAALWWEVVLNRARPSFSPDAAASVPRLKS
jgi:hypothetical protein